MIAVYPGSFDPVTFGHLDIITRAANVVDTLIVAVLNNSSKSPLFSVDERKQMLAQVCGHIPNVQIEAFSGLLVDFAQNKNANTIIRGLRAITDFEIELQMAQANKTLSPDIETLFICADAKFSFLSSSIVKEIAILGGDISSMAAEPIITKMHDKIQNSKEG